MDDRRLIRQSAWAVLCAACVVATVPLGLLMCRPEAFPGRPAAVMLSFFAGFPLMLVVLFEFDFLHGSQMLAPVWGFTVLQWIVIWLLGRRRLRRGEQLRYRRLLAWLVFWGGLSSLVILGP